MKFDTGSNGGFKMPLDLFSKISNSIKSVQFYGQTSASLYGKEAKSNKFISKIESIKMGDLELNDRIIMFRKQYSVIGNKLFQD